ncbi:MAG: cysteine synthase A [Faecousia sp.]
MAIYSSVEQLIGNTPLLELVKLSRQEQLPARLLAKLECFNPAGSVKDRVALSMLDAAERQGLIQQDTMIIEPTSGNTGIGLAAIAAARNLRCTIVMPESMSLERRKLITAYGASLILTPAARGMAGAIAAAKDFAAANPNSIILGQFTNPANPAAHRATAEEIWQDTQGTVDIFVAGVGTGGTITGVGEYLKEKNPQIQIIAAEPAGSPVLSGGKAGTHGIQGIGAGFIPEILSMEILDEIIPVTEEQAISCVRNLAKTEAVLAGISSGAALYAALCVARRPENKGKTVVTLFPDSGERYLSGSVYA